MRLTWWAHPYCCYPTCFCQSPHSQHALLDTSVSEDYSSQLLLTICKNTRDSRSEFRSIYSGTITLAHTVTNNACHFILKSDFSLWDLCQMSLKCTFTVQYSLRAAVRMTCPCFSTVSCMCTDGAVGMGVPGLNTLQPDCLRMSLPFCISTLYVEKYITEAEAKPFRHRL